MEEVEQPQPTETNETNETNDQQIQINPPKSKSQIKKEKAKEKWLEDKQKRKDRQKLKKKENQEKRRLEREANPEKRTKPPKAADGDEPLPLTSKKIKADYKKMVSEGQPIIIDCSFQDKLNEKEMISLCRQIIYSHAANKKVAKPVKLMVTSCTGKLRDQLVKMGGENWGILLLEKHYLDYYPKDKLVYLTGDCNEDITDLQMDTAYIIGGLVDHNRYKFATLNKAKEEGLTVKRLPISQHISLKSSTILSVNHVFDIMVKVANGEGWETSIKAAIPNRKREDEPKGEKEEGKEEEEEDIVSDNDEEDGEKDDNKSEPEQSAEGTNVQAEDKRDQQNLNENNGQENQKAE